MLKLWWKSVSLCLLAASFCLAYDVIVAGSGACGLTAALAAACSGANVLVLEASPDVDSSNTARSGGMIPAAGTRWQRNAGIFDDDPASFAADIFRKNGQQSDPQVTRRLTETAPLLVEWLVDKVGGIQLELVGDFKYPGHSQYRMHAPPSRTGAALVHDLYMAARRHPRIEFRVTKVLGLLTSEEASSEEGRNVRAVVGVRAAGTEHSNEISKIYGRKVILACNGFAANNEMVRQYCGPDMAEALYFGSPYSTGDAIKWGLQLGADTAFMDAYQAHASVSVAQKLLITYAVIMEGGFQVNKNGERFGNEVAGYSEHALLVLQQPDRVAWNIYDKRIHELALGFDGYRKADSCGVLVSGATISELAEKLGLAALSLAHSLEMYHLCSDGLQDDFYGRKDCRKLSGPFYGVKVTGALFHTQGGLVVDADARVLKKNGLPIPNLYAGGGVAAGISGHGADGYLSGNGLLAALGYGMLAGRHAARDIRTGLPVSLPPS